MTPSPSPSPAASIGDFDALVAAHRRELHRHCHRMTGSLGDADDLTQEVFLRAWRTRDRYRGDASPRTWLFRICTNACLDFLKSHQRRSRPSDTIEETLERSGWIDPYPGSTDPADEVVGTDATHLYLTVALLALPPRQRAAFVAAELLDLAPSDAAQVVGCSTAALNSLLQRARSRLHSLAPDLTELRASNPVTDPDEAIVRRYVEAHHRGDAAYIIDVLHDDVRISMPPEPACLGRSDATRFFDEILTSDRTGDWRLVPIRAGGLPAAANYLRSPGTTDYVATSIDVLRIVDGRVTAIHCFLGGHRLAAHGLPPTLH